MTPGYGRAVDRKHPHGLRTSPSGHAPRVTLCRIAGLRQAVHMKPLPLPVRVAAGLAVTAVDRARHLPEKLAGLPVTMVSQALQLSMRVQQQVTELAIKGDDALSTLRPAEESPEWATFDEDGTTNGTGSVRRSAFDAAADD